MSTPFAALLLAVICTVVLLTLHFTSKTPPISAEPSTGPPVAVPSPSSPLPTHAVIPDGSVVFR